jgi:hypothetical protein
MFRYELPTYEDFRYLLRALNQQTKPKGEAMKTMTKKAQCDEERQDAIRQLREMFPPGATVQVILRHRARSGMMQCISPVVSEYGDVSWLVACAIGDKVNEKYGGVTMRGTGMDMGFALVYALSCALYPEGFGCIGEGKVRGDDCPSNDHSNGDSYPAHVMGKGCGYDHDHGSACAGSHWHKEGGYALRMRWL